MSGHDGGAKSVSRGLEETDRGEMESGALLPVLARVLLLFLGLRNMNQERNVFRERHVAGREQRFPRAGIGSVGRGRRNDSRVTLPYRDEILHIGERGREVPGMRHGKDDGGLS